VSEELCETSEESCKASEEPNNQTNNNNQNNKEHKPRKASEELCIVSLFVMRFESHAKQANSHPNQVQS
jgi:hypothetical protein